MKNLENGIIVYFMRMTKSRKHKLNSLHIVKIVKNGEVIFSRNMYSGETDEFLRKFNIEHKGQFCKARLLTIDGNMKYRRKAIEGLIRFRGDGETYDFFDNKIDDCKKLH